METKLLEIRDRATFIGVYATSTTSADRAESFLLRRAGYGLESNSIILGRLDGGAKAHYDPYSWGDRTMQAAHNHIIEHFDKLKSGDVVDVEFILGEVEKPKISERLA